MMDYGVLLNKGEMYLGLSVTCGRPISKFVDYLKKLNLHVGPWGTPYRICCQFNVAASALRRAALFDVSM